MGKDSLRLKFILWTISIGLICAAFARMMGPTWQQHNESAKLFGTKATLVVAGSSSDSQIADVKFGEISPGDMLVLKTLPPICVADLPGLPHSVETQPCPAAIDPSTESKTETGTPHTPRIESLPPLAPVAQTRLIPAQAPTANNASSTDFRLAWAESQVAHEEKVISAAHFESYNPHAKATAARKANANPKTDDGTSDVEADHTNPADNIDPHLEAFSRSAFPSATQCKKCHEQIFDEWASSSHAYASISPMFHAFENKINKLTSGTIGYFCMRCHAPVATTMGLRRDQSIWDGPRVFREGVTCVACHRVKTPYAKTNGERRIEPGDLEEPVYGSSDGQGTSLVAEKYKDYFKTKTDPTSKKPGQLIHRRSIQFDELSKSTFCVSCHQVAVEPGIKLEVVWDQYRASPAYREGVTCQACHMGAIPGVNEGYTYGPAAVVDGKVVNPERKHSNHIFYGPGYSIAHPGVFPQNEASDRWTVNDWLTFDWRAGWGTEPFEEAIDKAGHANHFPHPWENVDDRMDAREIVDANLKKLDYKKDLRVQLLENGSKLDGPFFSTQPQIGQALNIRYCLTNTNTGHNMPSGSLGAQPQIWMNTVLIGPGGQRLWESGYLDSVGDLADNHSADVLARRLPLDTQLFNLQTKFLTANVKGTEREMFLPVNFDIDQLPFIRPAAQPVSVINHPTGIRLEGHSLPPLGSRNVKYSVPAYLMAQPGTYQLSVRMRSRAEPIYFMKFCDATPEMIRSMNEWIADFHESTVVFEVR